MIFTVRKLSAFNPVNKNDGFPQVNEIVDTHLRRLLTDPEDKDSWCCIVDQGDLKVFKRELEENGVPIDPMKAVCTVKVWASF